MSYIYMYIPRIDILFKLRQFSQLDANGKIKKKIYGGEKEKLCAQQKKKD